MTRWVLPIAALALLSALAPSAEASHGGPVRVNGDGDFSAAHWSGDGTLTNPYRLLTTTIVARDGFGVELSNVLGAHVNLSGLAITGGGAHSDGIHLFNVRNVTVWGSTLETNRVGVHVRGSDGVVIGGSIIKTSATGVYLEGSRNITLRDNRISLNDRDVQFRESAGNTLRNNNLSTATGQVGLFFDDNRSYDNSIDPTNVVNAMPVRWYTNLANATIADVTVDLAGMTNVAQVMVHNATNVRLERIVAKSGVGSGIVLHRSTNVTLEKPTAENNADHGIYVELANGARVVNASVRTNGASGVLLRSTRDAAIEASAISRNGREGVRIDASTERSTLEALALASNAARGVYVEASGNTTLMNSTLGGDALIVESARDVLARNNTFSGAGGTGIAVARSVGRFEANTIRDRATAVSFTASTGSNFSDNLIALATGGTGFAFDGPGSYDNALATTNLVNGTPLRWYTNVVGPVRLENLTVETRGITNVAQIMLYRSHNVTLLSPSAKNGTHAGVLVHRSDDANLSGASVATSGSVGVMVDASARPKLLGSTVASSSGDGVRFLEVEAPLVENTLVAGGRARGITVEGGTTPTLRGNAVRGNAGTGILVDLAGPGAAAIDHNAVELNAGGVQVSRSTLGSVRGNTIASNGGDGLVISSVPPGARVDTNIVSNHTRNIRLASAPGTELTSNILTISSGQWGVHFDDEASFNVSLATSNTANGVPLRWYVGASNVTVAGVRAELRGLTNVAQVMLYRVANVTLDDAVAANGTAHGIRVYQSENVSVLASRVENNTQLGLAVSQSRDILASGSFATRNGQDGVRVETTSRATVASLASGNNTRAGLAFDAVTSPRVMNGTFEGNAAAGLTVVGSGEARIENATLRRNAGGIVVTGSTLEALANNTLADNGDPGISMSTSSARLVERNVLSNHPRGFALDRVERITFRNNTVTYGTGQTAWHFAGLTAYDNDAGPTNTANGVPMQWYSQPRNLTIDGIRADARGMTNVAQVGLVGARNVTLVGALAENGDAHGFYLSGTEISLLSSTARGNAANGVNVDGSGELALRNSTFARNGGAGVRSHSGFRSVYDNLTVSENGGEGIADRDTLQLFVASSGIERNGGHGLSTLRSAQVNASRLSVRANGADGLSVSEASGLRLYDNVVQDARGSAYALHRVAAGGRVEGNRATNASFGIRFSSSEFLELHANALAIGAGQVGFQFDDETSYNNAIPTTNTVNGAPVHWYTTLAGTESNPITLSGVRAEVRGMTNVAQVMLYRSAYVSAPDLVATNGTTRGVFLYRSSAITLDRANVSNNTLIGADLHAAQSSVLMNIEARESATGVRLSDSHSNSVSGVNATGASIGVHLLGGSRDNRVDEVQVAGAGRGIRDDGWDGAGLAGNNLLADAGSSKRSKVGGTLSFADVTATHRHESARVVEQRWAWGDGTPDTVSTASSLLRPTHAYASAGTYRVELRVLLADGRLLTDSAMVEAVPPLSSPRSLFAWPGDRNVTLAWSAPEFDGAMPVTSYNIYRGLDPADLPRVATIGAETRFVDVALENGRSYIYQIAAVNADGEGPRASVVAMPIAPPGPPSALVLTPSPSAMALAWQPPSQLNGAPLQGYVVLRSMNGSAFAPVAVVGNVTTFADAGLTNGVPYTYAVRAYNALGNGTASANATATPLGPPSAPRELRALAGDASALLLWSPPADNGGTPVTGYRVYRIAANGTLAPLPGTLAANASTWRDTGLSNGQAYSYAVSAVNAFSEGARSVAVNVTPAAVDALKPVVYAHEPGRGALVKETLAQVGAQFVDNDGVVVESVRLYLDGAQVGAEIDNASARYRLPTPLARGEHTVRLVVLDPTGNEANETWTFRVLSEDDLVPVFVQMDHRLVPDRARPGENVTARLTIRNDGFAPGTAIVRVRDGEHSLALEVVDLAEGESKEIAISFAAPGLGVHALTVGDVVLDLAVEELALDAPTPEGLVSEPPTPEAPTDAGPRKPVRSVPPPREPEESNETPLPLVVTLLALAATAMRRRRR